MTGMFEGNVEGWYAVEQTRFSGNTGKGLIAGGNPLQLWMASDFQSNAVGMQKDAEELGNLGGISSDGDRGQCVRGEASEDFRSVFPYEDGGLSDGERLQGIGVVLEKVLEFTAVSEKPAANTGGKIGQAKEFLSVVGENVGAGKQAGVRREQEAFGGMNDQIGGHRKTPFLHNCSVEVRG